MPVNRSSQSAASHGAAGPSKDSFLMSALSHAAECPKDLESLLLTATGFVPELTQLYGRQPTYASADCVKSEVLSETGEHSGLEAAPVSSQVKANHSTSNRKHKYEQPSSDDSSPSKDAEMADIPTSNLTAENRKERRRRQLRSAQRAYRVRKATEITSLTDRISQLESALAEMGSTVISLSDMILSSNIREKDPRITAKLQQTIQKCLVLTRESGRKAADASALDEGNTTAQLVTQAPKSSLQDHTIPARLPLPDLPVGKSVTYSLFIDRLRISIAHYACTALVAGLPPKNRNFNPLWLLRAVMDKRRMISFFSALLHARITSVQLGTEWDDVPVFSIGGAGSHYVDPSTSSFTHAQHHSDRSSRWKKVQVDPKALPAKAHNELRGDWFDAQDLECYLEKKSVHLYTPPSSDNPWRKPPMQAFAVNITRLIAELLDVVICLGRTPGFRVTDVDRALSRAMLAA